MTRREQIIKIMDDYRSETCYGISSSDISLVADAILALPLDVPSDEEIMETIWEETDVSLSLKDKEENTVAYAMYLEIIRWAIWMKEEIIKRNK